MARRAMDDVRTPQPFSLQFAARLRHQLGLPIDAEPVMNKIATRLRCLSGHRPITKQQQRTGCVDPACRML